MKVQVNKEHYDFEKYVDIARWNSYYYQINEVLKCDGKDILYIGKGDDIVVNTLKQFGKNVTTFDFDKNLNPDICGSVTDIDKILNKKYDVIVCCQVLEHIPFDLFEETIQKISKCFKEKFILSLPNNNFWWGFGLNLPKFKNKKLRIPMKRFWKKRWDINTYGNGEHYWEIDAKGCISKNGITKLIQKYYNLERFYIPDNNTYHMFFILKSK